MSYIAFDKDKLVNIGFSREREILRCSRTGAFATTTLCGLNTRKYHGLFIVPQDNFGGKRHLLVSGINVHARHTKPTQARPQGGIVRTEAPLHMSKVAVEDPKTGKPTRVRFEERDGKKVRVAVRSGELING
jgi:ribosomal protein L24